MTASVIMAADDELSLSVGELVDFACRTGDLITSRPAGPSAQEGIRAHKKLQKQRPPGAEAEVPLKVSVTEAGIRFLLGGRVDILHPQTDLHRPVQLEEIKTTHCPPEQLAENQKARHWAQLKIYGFCYCEHQRLAGVDVERLSLQLLWYNLKEKKSYRNCREFSALSLAQFARDALSRYAEWLHLWREHRHRLVTSAKSLDFPFPDYRAGQRQMAVSIYRALRDGQPLVMEAPTGIGKTISSLYPAIKAMGEAVLDRVVYLTAKNSGRQAVRDAVARMRGDGLSLSLLVIQARDRTCACRVDECALDEDGVCPRTRGFYDRLPAARRELLAGELMAPEQVAQVAANHQLCPFELSLEMLPWANLVVCDFNYVFDPLVSLGDFQAGGLRTALLVDEAHNLGERGRGMYSASVSRGDIRHAVHLCRTAQPRLNPALTSLQRALNRWAGACDREVTVGLMGEPEQRPETVARAVNRLLEVLALLAEQGDTYPEALSDWIKNLYRFACIEQLAGDSHRSLTRVKKLDSAKRQEQSLQLLCMDAGDFLAERYTGFQSSVFFSATLRPPAYIYRQLGLADHAPYLALPSPFQSHQLGAFICPYVDTRYQQRDRALGPIVDIVMRVRQARRGNYLVFFPSYRFMAQVAEVFQARYPDVPLLLQQAGSDEESREAFLQHFAEGQQSLGFAILGGVYGEGVDFAGERLVGVVVIGVGLPQFGEEQELMRNVSEQRGENGFDVAYRYPGLTRVLQTAGRVIRSEQDRGVLVLVDSRFNQPFYRALYPQWWQLETCAAGDRLSSGLGRFWERAV